MDQCMTLIHSVTLREWLRVGEFDRQTDRQKDKDNHDDSEAVSSEK